MTNKQAALVCEYHTCIIKQTKLDVYEIASFDGMDIKDLAFFKLFFLFFSLFVFHYCSDPKCVNAILLFFFGASACVVSPAPSSRFLASPSWFTATATLNSTPAVGPSVSLGVGVGSTWSVTVTELAELGGALAPTPALEADSKDAATDPLAPATLLAVEPSRSLLATPGAGLCLATWLTAGL